jgi:Tol biopolymer transport system component
MKRMLPLAMTALLLIVPAAAQAAFPGKNGRIAFNWTFGCDGSMIASMKRDGSDRRLLTADACQVDGAPRAAYPDWTADGKQLVFVSGNRLATMNADGSDETLLPIPFMNDTNRPSIGPGGRKVAYTRVSGGRQRIYTAEVDGTGEKRLRTGYSPRFSPNGRSIAFAGTNGRLTIMRASDGEIRRRLDADAGALDWAPDGDHLVFPRFDDVYTIKSNGKGSAKRIVDSDARELSPVWSPNGKTIAFVRSLRAGEEDVRYGVFKVPADGGKPERIYRTSEERIEETLEPLTISWQAR